MSETYPQKDIWQLLACGQTFADSQQWLGGDNLVVYPVQSCGQGKHREITEELARVDGFLKPMLLSAANKTDARYFSAGALIIDDTAHWMIESLREEKVAVPKGSGSPQKLTAILGMNDPTGNIEKKAAKFWIDILLHLVEVMKEFKQESKWDTTRKDIMTFHYSEILINHCQERILFQIEKKTKIAKSIWKQLGPYAIETGASNLDPELVKAVSVFFSKLGEKKPDLVKICFEAEVLRDKYEIELREANTLFKSLYSNIKRADNDFLSARVKTIVGAVKDMLLDNEKGDFPESSFTSLKISEEELDLTAVDADTPFVLVRLILKLAQYPSSIRRLISLIDAFNSRYTLDIKTISGSWFQRLDFSKDSNLKPPQAEMGDAFKQFLAEKVLYMYGEPARIQYFGALWFSRMNKQNKPYVHGEVKIACYLLARGISAVNSRVNGTKLCCFTCDKFLKLLQKHAGFDIVVAGTHSKICTNWAFPSLEGIWEELDQTSKRGYYVKPGLTVEQEMVRRMVLRKGMETLADELVQEIQYKVKELAAAVLHSKSGVSESQPSVVHPDQPKQTVNTMEKIDLDERGDEMWEALKRPRPSQ